MIRLGQSMDGRLVLGSNEDFPAPVRHVEYYKDQRLFSLVFDTAHDESAILPCEICPRTAAIVQGSANIMIVPMAAKGEEPYGYVVPLVQIGI